MGAGRDRSELKAEIAERRKERLDSAAHASRIKAMDEAAKTVPVADRPGAIKASTATVKGAKSQRVGPADLIDSETTAQYAARRAREVKQEVRNERLASAPARARKEKAVNRAYHKTYVDKKRGYSERRDPQTGEMVTVLKNAPSPSAPIPDARPDIAKKQQAEPSTGAYSVRINATIPKKVAPDTVPKRSGRKSTTVIPKGTPVSTGTTSKKEAAATKQAMKGSRVKAARERQRIWADVDTDSGAELSVKDQMALSGQMVRLGKAPSPDKTMVLSSPSDNSATRRAAAARGDTSSAVGDAGYFTPTPDELRTAAQSGRKGNRNSIRVRQASGLVVGPAFRRSSSGRRKAGKPGTTERGMSSNEAALVYDINEGTNQLITRTMEERPFGAGNPSKHQGVAFRPNPAEVEPGKLTPIRFRPAQDNGGKPIIQDGKPKMVPTESVIGAATRRGSELRVGKIEDARPMNVKQPAESIGEYVRKKQATLPKPAKQKAIPPLPTEKEPKRWSARQAALAEHAATPSVEESEAAMKASANSFESNWQPSPTNRLLRQEWNTMTGDLDPRRAMGALILSRGRTPSLKETRPRLYHFGAGHQMAHF